MKELRELAYFVKQFNFDKMEENVLEAAKLCILDTIGISLGANADQLFQKIKNTYAAYDGQSDCMKSAVWGDPNLTALRTTIFLNAMMGHILELDDVHTTSKTHIGTVVIPAAWGLAEYLNKNGKELLEAVVCGYEVAARIGMGFGVSSHRNRGWHATGTAGVFGAAAACAKLLSFDTDQIVSAFGMAGTQACSTWAFLTDGATNKILHPARAAVNGLESCLLTQGGMTGSAHILDSNDGGIFPMMSDEYDYSLVSKNLGTHFEILNVDKKPYPCCRSTHCAIDVAIYLKELHNIDIGHIKEIIVKTYLVGMKQCGLAQSSVAPKVATDAKFSTPYTVACAFTTGGVSLEDFEIEAIERKEVRDLMSRVKVLADDKFTDRYPNHWGCKMEVHLHDGTIYCHEITDASGSVSSPLSARQVLLKVSSCCSSYNDSWINGIFQDILQVEALKTLPSLQYQF